jgi:hypothetical protein
LVGVADAVSAEETSEESGTSSAACPPAIEASLARPLVASPTAVELSAPVVGGAPSAALTTIAAATGCIALGDALNAAVVSSGPSLALVWSVLSLSSLDGALDDDVVIAETGWSASATIAASVAGFSVPLAFVTAVPLFAAFAAALFAGGAAALPLSKAGLV